MTTSINNDERTSAVGLFNTARSYWRSAVTLNEVDLNVTHPQAPIIFLLCHAIELYLKAYLRSAGTSLADLKRIGHRVADLANYAAKSGLSLEPEQFEILSHIDHADVAIEARYIVTGFKNRPTNEALSVVSEHLDRAVCDALAKLGLPVRLEKFVYPKPLQPSKKNEKMDQVLIYLFKTDSDSYRTIPYISSTLAMPQNAVKYYVDQLRDLGLASFNGSVWSVTSDGLRHVVERGLI